MELDSLQLKPTLISLDNSGCVASAHNVHLRERSKHVALHVCFIQQVTEDGNISAKQCPIPVQIPWDQSFALITLRILYRSTS